MLCNVSRALIQRSSSFVHKNLYPHLNLDGSVVVSRDQAAALSGVVNLETTSSDSRQGLCFFFQPSSKVCFARLVDQWLTP